MRDVCVLLYFIYTLYINVCESRVHCQDNNALSWSPHGYSCPVTCNTIVDTIQKLKINDYKTIIRQDINNDLKEEILHDKAVATVGEINKVFLRLIRRNFISLFKNENDTDIKMNESYENNAINVTLTNRNNENDTDNKDWNRNVTTEKNITQDTDLSNYNIDIENYIDTDNVQNDLNVYLKYNKDNVESDSRQDIIKMEQTNNVKIKYGCWSFDKFDAKSLLIKLTRITCTRKSNFDERLLVIMTNILNQYIKSPFKFTKEITEMLLEKLFGKNTDLRNNIFDVNNLLKYLKKSITQHRSHEDEPKIFLSPRHCLLIKIPGCFCKSGYVESSGQCVKPYDCVNRYKEGKYLARIMVQ